MALRNDENLQVMKRVVGLPGETVALKGSDLLINGAPVERPLSLSEIKYVACGTLFRGKAAECGGGYFVLGDNTGDSWDSRFTGPIMPKRLVGRPWLIIWPLSRAGFVNP